MSFLTTENILLGVDVALVACGVSVLAKHWLGCKGKCHSHSASKKLVLVTGATGAQGGSVVESLLANGTFAVRGVSRNAESDKAKQLKQKGVEVVSADLTNKADMAAAARGCDYAFIVTQFWEKFSEEDEILQGKTTIDACIAAGVKHIVLSTLPPAKKLSGVAVPHLDAKWVLAEYLRQRAKEARIGHTLVFVPFYSENFLGLGMIRQDDGGNASLALPMGDKKWGLCSVAEIGTVIWPIFAHPNRYDGFLIDIYAEQVSLADVAKAYQSATSKPLAVQAVPVATYAKFGFPGAEELAAMFQFFQWIADARVKTSNPYVSLVDSTHYLNNTRGLTNLETFFKKNIKKA